MSLYTTGRIPADSYAFLSTAPEDLSRLRPDGPIYLDIETAGRERDAAVTMIQVSDGVFTYALDTRGFDPSGVLSTLRDRQIIGHNLKFDLNRLLRYGFDARRVFDTYIAELLLTAGKPVHHDLSTVSTKYAGRTLDKTLQTSFGTEDAFTTEQIEYGLSDVLVLPAIYKAQRSALAIDGLVQVASMEFELVPVLARMEARGILLDLVGAEVENERLAAEQAALAERLMEALTPYVIEWRERRVAASAELTQHFREERAAKLARIEAAHPPEDFIVTIPDGRGGEKRRVDLASRRRLIQQEMRAWRGLQDAPKALKMDQGPILLSSSQQLTAALNLLTGGRPYFKNAEAETIAEALGELEGQTARVLEGLLDWKELAKLRSSTLEPLIAMARAGDGRIRTDFTQIVRTGRMASSDPNLQNIPIEGERGERIRRKFIAPDGRVLISGDYSQIELRVLAEDIYHRTGGRTLLDIFQRGDSDPHRATAALMFDRPYESIAKESQERRTAKNINFGLSYGMTEYGLARKLNRPVSEAKALMDLYFSKLPDVDKWAKGIEEEVLARGYSVTMLGRRRYLPEIAPEERGSKYKRERADRHLRNIARNTRIQGTAADILKKAILAADAGLEGVADLLLPVHDELVDEADREDAVEAGEITYQAMMEAGRAVLHDCPVEVDITSGETWS